MLIRLFIVLYLVRRIVVRVARVIYQTHSVGPTRLLWPAARLSWLALRAPRCVPGTFRFSFGQVRYVDALSLLGQFCGIFVDRGYEVSGVGDMPTIIDCGGNVGLSAIWFKQRYPRAAITVFEADPAVADVLEENARTLGLEQVEVVRAAVAHRSGTITFVPDGVDGGRIGSGPGLTVDAVRLSDWICGSVDILKVDIEGSEFALFEDLCASGRIGLIRALICEVHGRDDVRDRFGKLWTDLVDAGFRVTVAGAETAPWLAGPAELSPFPFAPSAKFVLHLYAWQPVSDSWPA